MGSKKLDKDMTVRAMNVLTEKYGEEKLKNELGGQYFRTDGFSFWINRRKDFRIWDLSLLKDPEPVNTKIVSFNQKIEEYKLEYAEEVFGFNPEKNWNDLMLCIRLIEQKGYEVNIYSQVHEFDSEVQAEVLDAKASVPIFMNICKEADIDDEKEDPRLEAVWQLIKDFAIAYYRGVEEICNG
jgi:hypothetical protein